MHAATAASSPPTILRSSPLQSSSSVANCPLEQSSTRRQSSSGAVLNSSPTVLWSSTQLVASRPLEQYSTRRQSSSGAVLNSSSAALRSTPQQSGFPVTVGAILISRCPSAADEGLRLGLCVSVLCEDCIPPAPALLISWEAAIGETMWLPYAILGCLFLMPAVSTWGSQQARAVTPRPPPTTTSTARMAKSAALAASSPNPCMSGTLCTRAMCPFESTYRFHEPTGTSVVENTCKDGVLDEKCCKVNGSCRENRDDAICRQFRQEVRLGDGTWLWINTGCGCVKHRQSSEASKPAGRFVAAPERKDGRH